MRVTPVVAQQRACARGHPVLIGAQTPTEQRQFSMHTLDEQQLTLDWLNQHYDMGGVIGVGAHGVVLAATGRIAPVPVVIKLQVSDFGNSMREGRVRRMLTELWTKNGLDTAVHAPVIKVYDYARVSIRVEVDALLNWVLSNSEPEETTQEHRKYLNDGFVRSGDYDKGKNTILATFLVEERVDGTLFDAMKQLHAESHDPQHYLRSFLLQTLLTLHMLQELLHFVHGDLHTKNVFYKRLQEPVVLRYAVAPDVVVHIETDLVVKLGGMGLVYMDVPAPLAESHGLDGAKVVPHHSGYNFHSNDRTRYRPWQDVQRLANNMVTIGAYNSWYTLFTGGLGRVLESMLDVDPVEEITVPTNNWPTDDATPEERRKYMQDVDKYIQNRKNAVDAAFKLPKVLNLIIVNPNASPMVQEIYLRHAYEAALEFAHDVFDAEPGAAVPRSIIKKNVSYFLPELAYRPRDDVPIVDMTLSIDGRSAATGDAWNLGNLTTADISHGAAAAAAAAAVPETELHSNNTRTRVAVTSPQGSPADASP